MKNLNILSLLMCLSALSAHSQNLVSSQSWTIGSGSVGIFDDNGIASENIREMGLGPDGTETILWKAVPNTEGNASGGWNTALFPIDRTKMYRFAIWIKKTNSTDGKTYFGCDANDILTLSGVANSNPYFWSGDLPALDKWYLLVGYVHASDDPSTAHYGGIYDGETGTKLLSITDFKFSPSATSAYHRTYLYYDTNTSNRQYFYGPEVYQVESNQPLSEFNSASIFNGNAFFGKKVGIGTTSPRGVLDVDGEGDIYLSDDPLEGTNQSLYLPGHIYLSPYSGNDISYLQARRSDNSGTTSLRLRTYNNGALTESMHISGNGNVGIGTVSPNERLTVNGTIYGKEVKVDLSVPGPDYVFEEDYPLPSLQEIESFIDQNKHLPEVPSAKEMEVNGIKVGEMNMILLKKVEELTLYILRQQAQLEVLQQEIKLLKEHKERR